MTFFLLMACEKRSQHSLRLLPSPRERSKDMAALRLSGVNLMLLDKWRLLIDRDRGRRAMWGCILLHFSSGHNKMPS